MDGWSRDGSPLYIQGFRREWTTWTTHSYSLKKKRIVKIAPETSFPVRGPYPSLTRPECERHRGGPRF